MEKMNNVVFILFLLVLLASGEIDWKILDKISKCLPNERFNNINYISVQKASDENFNHQFDSVENNPFMLVGIHDR